MENKKIMVTLVNFITGETLKREMTASQIYEALRDGFVITASI